MYLYKITNLINGKCYIGQTNNYKRRMMYHKAPCTKSLISRSIQKYGKENFKFEILDEIVEELIDGEERQAIITYNSLVPNGYNLEEGGRKCKDVTTYSTIALSNTGKKRTYEQRLKISKANKGKVRSKEICDKMAQTFKGKVPWNKGLKATQTAKDNQAKAQKKLWENEEHRNKMSLAHKGQRKSEETLLKLSKSLKKSWEFKKGIKGGAVFECSVS